MELLLIRHAPAVPRRPDLEDPERALTRRGRRRWARAVKGLERLGLRFDALHHSPWLRAVETAAALAPLVEGRLVENARLAQPGDEDLLATLSGERVGLVGHEPWLGELLGHLIGAPLGAEGGLTLKKGSVAWLKGEPRKGGMRLQALLPPKLLRALAER